MNISRIVMVLTLLSLVLIVYHHLIYPMILRLACKYRTSSDSEGNDNNNRKSSIITLPTISLVVPAYNEQQWIADKIRNLAILDYPPELLKIIIACDGCTDDTVKIAEQTVAEQSFQGLPIEVRHFPHNRGKVAIINDVVSTVESELVALSDVSALVSVDALRIAARRFQEPKLGVLNGHYHLLAPGSAGEHAYWEYQCQIKLGEAALGSTLGAHGAFYLFRRALFQPLNPETINDDFILPMIIVGAGFHADYEQRINILEQEQSTATMDRNRRLRIAAGNMQQLIFLKGLLLPTHGRIAFLFFSGKGLRVLMPFLMLMTLVGSLLLTNHLFFLVLAIFQGCVYGVAGWCLLTNPKHSSRYVKAVAYLVAGHLAALMGGIRYLCGLEKGHWKRVNSDQIDSSQVQEVIK